MFHLLVKTNVVSPNLAIYLLVTCPNPPPCRRLTIHIIASLLYVACMRLYAIYAFHDFATYEPATLFSSLPTNSVPPVGLKVEVDCLDCRPFYGRREFGEIWTLKWDYTGLGLSGCAAGLEETSEAQTLCKFCKIQNDPTISKYTKIQHAFW